MNEKLNIAEIIKTGFILFAITALSAALLAFVNSKTEPLIEQNAIIKEQTAMREVLPQAADFDEKEITPEIESLAENNGEITKAYTALDDNGDVIGACVITETTGYDVGIQTVTGVDTDLTVTGIDIISMNETPGLGAKAADDAFKEQYDGKEEGIKVSKSDASGNEIEAISGATKTSNGVTNGVNMALGAAEILLEGGNE